MKRKDEHTRQQCLRCLYVWWQRGQDVPRKCPECGSRKWQEARQVEEAAQ